jgi:hypothetical protein
MSEQQSPMGGQDHRAPEGYRTWRDYWAAQGMPWRIEPEIDQERQQYLRERQAITPNIEQDIYPFKDIKVGRADVEWLLAAYNSSKLSADGFPIQ